MSVAFHIPSVAYWISIILIDDTKNPHHYLNLSLPNPITFASLITRLAPPGNIERLIWVVTTILIFFMMSFSVYELPCNCDYNLLYWKNNQNKLNWKLQAVSTNF